MSYYTNVFLDVDTEVDSTKLMAVAKQYLKDVGTYDVEESLADLEKTLAEGRGSFPWYFEDLDTLFKHLSKNVPKVTFMLRGVGEEFEDIWAREYSNGKVKFREGPFGDDAEDESDDEDIDEGDPESYNDQSPEGQLKDLKDALDLIAAPAAVQHRFLKENGLEDIEECADAIIDQFDNMRFCIKGLLKQQKIDQPQYQALQTLDKTLSGLSANRSDLLSRAALSHSKEWEAIRQAAQQIRGSL